MIEGKLDLDYRIRHEALPKPGGMEELRALIAQLHAVPLDRGGPLWEYHFIEGLKDGGFAVYIKVHHSSMDGIAGMATLGVTYDFAPGAEHENLPLRIVPPDVEPECSRPSLRFQASGCPALVLAASHQTMSGQRAMRFRDDRALPHPSLLVCKIGSQASPFGLNRFGAILRNSPELTLSRYSRSTSSTKETGGRCCVCRNWRSRGRPSRSARAVRII